MVNPDENITIRSYKHSEELHFGSRGPKFDIQMVSTTISQHDLAKPFELGKARSQLAEHDLAKFPAINSQNVDREEIPETKGGQNAGTYQKFPDQGNGRFLGSSEKTQNSTIGAQPVVNGKCVTVIGPVTTEPSTGT